MKRYKHLSLEAANNETGKIIRQIDSEYLSTKQREDLRSRIHELGCVVRYHIAKRYPNEYRMSDEAREYMEGDGK